MSDTCESGLAFASESAAGRINFIRNWERNHGQESIGRSPEKSAPGAGRRGCLHGTYTPSTRQEKEEGNPLPTPRHNELDVPFALYRYTMLTADQLCSLLLDQPDSAYQRLER